MIQARFIQILNTIWHQQISISNQTCQTTVMADAGDDLIQIWMQQRFPTTDHDQRGTQTMQMVDALQHYVNINWLGKIVEFVAIGARQIAASHGNQVSLDNMIGVQKPMRNEAKFPSAPTERNPIAPYPEGHIGHIYELPFKHTKPPRGTQTGPNSAISDPNGSSAYFFGGNGGAFCGAAAGSTTSPKVILVSLLNCL